MCKKTPKRYVGAIIATLGIPATAASQPGPLVLFNNPYLSSEYLNTKIITSYFLYFQKNKNKEKSREKVIYTSQTAPGEKKGTSLLDTCAGLIVRKLGVLKNQKHLFQGYSYLCQDITN